jgi:16S rRNA (cytosine967-C5)-methyltransferase
VVAGTAAREAALEILRRVRDGRRFDTALNHAVQDLSPLDRRLAHEIAAGVLRSRTELDRVLAPCSARNWRSLSPDVRDLLRIGAYQVLRLERVPDYAALSTTVQVAKHAGHGKAAGLVNAVLRRLVEDPTLGEHPAVPGDLAGTYSHPNWLVERWLAQFGPKQTEALLQHNNTRSDIVLQPLRWTRVELWHALSDAGYTPREAPFGDGIIVDTARVRVLPGFEDGAFVVQDAAQARLIEFAAFSRDSVVWDACAAPGGKAAVLSARRCSVLASDARRDRLRTLQDSLTRTATRPTLLLADARHPPIRCGSVDAVLVDAPCSATGTMARHPDARWRLSSSRLRRLVEQQRAMLEGVATVLAPGGLLVYLTCSLESEENEGQVEGFLERHPTFCREGEDLRIFPTDAGTDGGFGARMRRVG